MQLMHVHVCMRKFCSLHNNCQHHLLHHCRRKYHPRVGRSRNWGKGGGGSVKVWQGPGGAK